MALPSKATKYRYDAIDNPNGRGEFLMVLPEAGSQTSPKIATYHILDIWAQTYDVEIPLVNDPEYQLEPVMLSKQMAWPCNILVNTRTMTIVEVIAGAPTSTFWNKYDDVLAGTL